MALQQNETPMEILNGYLANKYSDNRCCIKCKESMNSEEVYITSCGCDFTEDQLQTITDLQKVGFSLEVARMLVRASVKMGEIDNMLLNIADSVIE